MKRARETVVDDGLLLRVIKEGDISQVQKLLKSGANANAKHKSTPALCEALNWGHFEIAKLLIKYGADVNSKNSYGSRALSCVHYNFIHGRMSYDDWRVYSLRAAKLLLENGADVNAKNNNGFTALHHASLAGHSGVIQFLIDNGADIEAKNGGGRAPLQHACGFENEAPSDLEGIASLVDNGANIHAKDNNGWTALHSAHAEGHSEIVRYFIDHGADVNTTANDGTTPLHCAVENADSIMLLIASNANINSKGNDGATPLHKACSIPCEMEYASDEEFEIEHRSEIAEQMCEIFLDNGAEVNAVNNDGETPLHILCLREHMFLEVTRLLLRRGANVNAATKKGLTPLHIVCRGRHLEIAELLFERNADLEAKDKNDETPVFCASLEMLRRLLCRGANVNVHSKSSGDTPLHRMCRFGLLEKAKLLLDHGAEVNAKSHFGGTALFYACWGPVNSLELVKLLLSRGADVNSKTKQGFTPLHFACKRKKVDIVWLLVRKYPWLVAEL